MKPLYTQKYFEDLALFIRNSNLENKYQFAQDLASHFQADNPKFKVDRFFKACGLLMYNECTQEQDGPTEQQELSYLENQTAQEEAFTESEDF
jgi:hypothetical protein